LQKGRPSPLTSRNKTTKNLKKKKIKVKIAIEVEIEKK
jgi:hypothetical protein